MIAELYVTIRGCSFASGWIEHYKQEQEKNQCRDHKRVHVYSYTLFFVIYMYLTLPVDRPFTPILVLSTSKLFKGASGMAGSGREMSVSGMDTGRVIGVYFFLS